MQRSRQCTSIIPRFDRRQSGRPASPALARQATRFCIVGFVNTVVDLAVLNILILVWPDGHSGPLFTAFKTISFLVAVANSYVMNAKWTFGGSGGRNTPIQGAQFLAVSIIGSILNIGSASYVATFIEPPAALHAYWPSIAALVGTFFSFLFNFLGYKYFVFSEGAAAALENEPDIPPQDGDA